MYILVFQFSLNQLLTPLQTHSLLSHDLGSPVCPAASEKYTEKISSSHLTILLIACYHSFIAMYTCTKLAIDRLQSSTKGPFSGAARSITDQWSFLSQRKFSLMHHRRTGKEKYLTSFIWPSARPGIRGRAGHLSRFLCVPHRTGRKLHPAFLSNTLRFVYPFVRFKTMVSQQRGGSRNAIRSLARSFGNLDPSRWR